jgi:hypothetical protein
MSRALERAQQPIATSALNIVGTVSQSSGVPTGAIIERGSNANGEFVKYADGTLICYRFEPSRSIPTSTLQLDFPATTASNSIVAAGGFTGSTGLTDIDDLYEKRIVFTGPSLSTGNSWRIRARSSGASFSFHLFAIGRWY